ncbi:MAG: glutathione peroxidase [Betaproteobacteria bacterium]
MSLPRLNLTRLDGSSEDLLDYQGSVLLIVNVASQCGFTPQYKDLEDLYRRYKEVGLVVMGFPCNQFGRQEPGSNEDIGEFCSSKFNISFPMFAKCDVNGPGAHPLFIHLKAAAQGILGTEAIKWNFTKFLVNREGEVVGRFGSADGVAKIVPQIRQLLGNE